MYATEHMYSPQQFHYLHIKHRIDFTIANITFRTLHCSQPAYLRSSLHACHSTCSLRLSNTNRLSAPFVRTSSGSRSFSVAAPKIWNSLPLSLRTCTSPDTFRRHLKTHASRPSTPLTPSALAPQIRLLLTIVHAYKLYLPTYLLTRLATFGVATLHFWTHRPHAVRRRGPFLHVSHHVAWSLSRSRLWLPWSPGIRWRRSVVGGGRGRV